jgi:fatty-acyl-CoA synthase
MTHAGFSTLVEALLAAPPDRPFITMWCDEDESDTVTFGEFIRLAQAQAATLRDQGMRVGDAVVLVMPQGIPLMAAFAGALLAGGVPAILAYPNFKVDPGKYTSGLAGVSQNLKARLVLVDEGFPPEFSVHLGMADDVVLLRAPKTSTSVAETRLRVHADPDPDAIALIQHSAGTTGLQKGVALSHGAVLAHLEHLATALRIEDRDRIYSWLPLYHDMGLIACFMLPLVYHLPIVMQAPMDWVFRPGTMLELISSHHCTLAWVPNFALQFMARRVRPEDRREYQLSSLRALINCSEPVRATSLDEFQDIYGAYGLHPAALQSSYAMAENVFAVTQSDIGEPPRRLWVDARRFWSDHVAFPTDAGAEGGLCFVSSGRCLANNRFQIVAADGAPLPDGAVGEILIRSDSLFTGYYNRPDLTAQALRDGWYWSGDLGFAVDGELYVVGRKKDLIIVAGKNIQPQDIEEIVSSHPAIHDGRAVAFGLYNPDLGTEDIVVVAEAQHENELSNARAIEAALRNAIVAELDVAPRKIYVKPPRWIVKSTAGKPARSTTREKLIAEHPELQPLNRHE